MERRPAFPSSFETHFIDIHEVLPEEEDKGKTQKIDKADHKRINRPIKVRDTNKRPHRSLNRQVSLETGFSVHNWESKAKDDRRVLTRSGRSLGGFDSANRIGLGAPKGDFSLFKTKPTLSKQNPLLPSRKEREMVSTGLDDWVNESVPAGRYFAALRGPELDQVKVIFTFSW